MKKIIFVILSIFVITVAVFVGWQLKTTSVQKDRDSAFQPASSLIDSISSESGTKELYANTTEVYKKTISEDEFNKIMNEVKNAQVSEFQEYTGIVDNISVYQMVKEDSTYSISIITNNDEGSWKISSIQISKQTI